MQKKTQAIYSSEDCERKTYWGRLWQEHTWRKEQEESQLGTQGERQRKHSCCEPLVLLRMRGLVQRKPDSLFILWNLD